MSSTQKTLPQYVRWEDVPDNLKTATQLSLMNKRPHKEQKPVALKTHWKPGTPDYELFEASEAVLKRAPSSGQAAALKKAQEASVEARTCKGCGYVEPLGRRYRGKVYVTDGYCAQCHFAQQIERDRRAAAVWAKEVLSTDNALILDTETTGLAGEIIELAIVDMTGNVRFNGRFKPQTTIEPGAAAVHGLTAEILAREPDWADRYEEIKAILTNAAAVLIYNRDFDTERIDSMSRRRGLELIRFTSDCVMVWYAQFVGDWSESRRSYRWQPLCGGDHSALGDCLATLSVVQEMGAYLGEIEGQEGATAAAT